MSDLSRRPRNRPARSARVERGYQLVVAGGTSAAVAVVTAVLAIVGVIGWGLPVIAVLVAIACLLLFRRTVGR
jgi:hypothetical protein